MAKELLKTIGFVKSEVSDLLTSSQDLFKQAEIESIHICQLQTKLNRKLATLDRQLEQLKKNTSENVGEVALYQQTYEEGATLISKAEDMLDDMKVQLVFDEKNERKLQEIELI